MKTPRFTKLLVGVALLAIAIPASAAAQATRTWVSGVGDDANPCSRTAPCKTFAGAISKTAAKGEINAMDDGGFGGVTITKSITINGRAHMAGVLVSGTNAIVVNAAATDKVILRNLNINGIGTGLNGIRILQAKSVTIQDTDIFGFVRNGIDFEPSNGLAKLFVSRVTISDVTGNGLLVAPPSTGNGANATIRDSDLIGNGCGIAATSHGPDPAFNYAANCGTNTTGAAGSAVITAFGNSIRDHANTGGATGSAGVFSNGPSAQVLIGNNEITGNNLGVKTLDTGAFGGIFSYSDNYLAFNTTDGNPTGTLIKK